MAESILDVLASHGGTYLYDKYLATKHNRHCAKRTITYLSEASQVNFFPGDPGEEEEPELFQSAWLPEDEPQPAALDTWTRSHVRLKHVVKVENNTADEPPSSLRSKKAPSVSTQRKTSKKS